MDLDISRASRVIKEMLRWMPEIRAIAGEPHKDPRLNISQVIELYELSLRIIIEGHFSYDAS